LLSLIACAGLRVSEALKLELSDITEDGPLIRATKFQKSRLVPLAAIRSDAVRRPGRSCAAHRANRQPERGEEGDFGPAWDRKSVGQLPNEPNGASVDPVARNNSPE